MVITLNGILFAVNSRAVYFHFILWNNLYLEYEKGFFFVYFSFMVAQTLIGSYLIFLGYYVYLLLNVSVMEMFNHFSLILPQSLFSWNPSFCF